MDDQERKALENLRFDWAPTPEDVWDPTTPHVEGLNETALTTVMAAYDDAKASRGPSPLGVAITGQQGSGKTHMLGVVRAEVRRRGGYFFLVSLSQSDFWQNIVHALRNGLHYSGPSGERQLTVVLVRLANRLDLPDEARRQVVGEAPLTKWALDEVVHALGRTDPQRGHECRHTARALVLLAAKDLAANEVGESYLVSASEAVPGERNSWGIHPDPKDAHQIVGELSRLISLTGPSLLAIDQIDTLISQSQRLTHEDSSVPSGETENLLDQVGSGLMALRETMQRTVSVVACQHQVWSSLEKHTTGAVISRFRQESRLKTVPTAAIGQALVETRFRQRFEEVGFTPPYPSWPVMPDAFSGAVHFTPRQLFKQVDEHIRTCLEAGVLVTLASLTSRVGLKTRRKPQVESVSDAQADSLDERFAALARAADLSIALDKVGEDSRMPELLTAGLRTYIFEQGDDRKRYSLDNRQGANPSLHAKLRRILDEESEDQAHWCFRAVASADPRAAQNRIERLRVAAGLDPNVPKRKAFLLRTGPWKTTTKKTGEKLDAFLAAGGVFLDRVDLDDLKAFDALEKLWDEDPPGLKPWLQQRKPASGTALFRAVFGEPEREPDPGGPALPLPHDDNAGWPDEDLDVVEPPAPAPAAVAVPPGFLSLGESTDTDEPVPIPLEALRKHAVIFAGSGSGKTVLIRRLLEECALQGVSAIVLDPNNDLARLGDAWPKPPGGWSPGDDVKAADYLAGTDVVVWTPNYESGRPLSFQPLPDLAALKGDPDEFRLALDTAVAGLAPRARADGSTVKADLARAALKEALAYFAHTGGGSLESFLDLLSDLPDGVTSLTKGQAMAADMSETLKAAMINDPLFGGSGTPFDPGVLLTPAPGKRARISVISLIGLPSDQQRQSFVNQLQMALFAWIKRHPAGDRPLGGLFVMDEAQTLAPSGAMTACTSSTLALASQARKYGLGLVFATQAPKGIHNRIVGNAATQYFGFINSPTQVAAAKEMAAAKGSTVLDISRLTAGQFYAVGEGLPFRRVRSPMCLSHHPSSALTAEEVLVRARTERQ
ncbi:helicase HerA domain-containing protein [Umezawaea sp. NPDC059074]|uniref:helicase HerA domain-containing protein n=1 Tax=Umezawaea sp. NPDC059074 TaxID=3346716 RepID=UPI0036A8D9DF